jgi:hypothetical protein
MLQFIQNPDSCGCRILRGEAHEGAAVRSATSAKVVCLLEVVEHASKR